MLETVYPGVPCYLSGLYRVFHCLVIDQCVLCCTCIYFLHRTGVIHDGWLLLSSETTVRDQRYTSFQYTDSWHYNTGIYMMESILYQDTQWSRLYLSLTHTCVHLFTGKLISNWWSRLEWFHCMCIYIAMHNKLGALWITWQLTETCCTLMHA